MDCFLDLSVLCTCLRDKDLNLDSKSRSSLIRVQWHNCKKMCDKDRLKVFSLENCVTSVTTINFEFFHRGHQIVIICGWTLNPCIVFVKEECLAKPYCFFSVANLKFFHSFCHRK